MPREKTGGGSLAEDGEPREPFEGIPARGFTLLKQLAEHNEPGWVRENGDRLFAALRDPFVLYLDDTTRRLAVEGIELQGGRGTLFRMHRDRRFARDARPLHEHVEAVFSQNGRRIGSRAAIHVRLDVRGGFLAAGSFLQPSAATRALRESMVARERTFLRLARDLEGASAPLTSESSLARAPRGFQDAAEGRLGPYLRMREPRALMPLDRAAWRTGDVVERTVEFARLTRRWGMFQREALADVPDVVARPPKAPPKSSPGPTRRVPGRR
ncbi:MAG: DUF2461 family protein [Planctomycetota bacterium]